MANPTNPPIPAGLRLLEQSEVTPAITTWAVAVLNASTQPMFSFSCVPQPSLGPCVAHVEWHPPEPSIPSWHRGVTVYQVIGALSLADFVSFTGGSSSLPTPIPGYDLSTVAGQQRALNALGASPPLLVDGVRGPKTIAATKAFQSTHRDADGHPLVIDGVIGPITTAALRAALQAL